MRLKTILNRIDPLEGFVFEEMCLLVLILVTPKPGPPGAADVV